MHVQGRCCKGKVLVPRYTIWFRVCVKGTCCWIRGTHHDGVGRLEVGGGQCVLPVGELDVAETAHCLLTAERDQAGMRVSAPRGRAAKGLVTIAARSRVALPDRSAVLRTFCRLIEAATSPYMMGERPLGRRTGG